jgi:hypothetical protein
MPLRIKDVSIYTVRDVALRLGIAEGTVRKYLREGRIVGRKHAGAWHVTEESFRAFVQHMGDDFRPVDLPQTQTSRPHHFTRFRRLSLNRHPRGPLHRSSQPHPSARRGWTNWNG